MSNLELTVEALKRCVPSAAFEKAMEEVRSNSVELAAPPNEDLEQRIRGVMLELGVPAHLKGYAYIISSLEMVIKTHDISFTKELYPAVAKIHGSTKNRVERAIRHAIEVAWDRGDLNVQYRYFGNTVSADNGKPTNSEFLTTVAYAIRQEMKECH